MNQFKRAKVIMLPTNQKVDKGIWLRKAIFGTDQYLFHNMIVGPVHSNESYQHLYIISDDEIKEGDEGYKYCINTNTVLPIRHCKNGLCKDCKKIIATTDT